MASFLTCLFLIATVQVFNTEAECPPSTMLANSSAQVLQSPNYPMQYPRNMSCGIVISTTTAREVIHIRSIEMHLYGDKDNCGDNIAFYDGNTSNAPRLKMACGDELITVQSTGQNLFVMYTFDTYREDKGFYLHYWSALPATPNCDANGKKTVDVRSNPVYLYLPQMSGSSATDCEYQLRAAAATDMVYVDIHDWDKPESLACGRGSMMVYNGPDTNGVKMIEACGAERPFWSVSSSGQFLTIKLKFETTPPANSKGFYIRAMSKSKNPASCSEVANMPIGPMSSYVWFPIFSAGGQLCEKTFLAPQTTAHLTVLHTESTKQQTPCTAAGIPFTAHEMPGNTRVNFMCMGNQPTYRTTGQNLKLSPTAGSPLTVLLKVASFESYCNGGNPMEMMANNKTMEEKHFEHIQRNSNCMRRIKAPTAEDQVQLMLKSTLPNGDCVNVYDGMDASAAMVYSMCGAFEKMLASSGQYLTFSISADNRDTTGKVTVKYFSFGNKANCPKEMNLLARRQKVNLTTPNFPMEYPLNAMCQWRFVSYRPDYVVVIQVLESDLPEDCSDVAFVNDGETHETKKLGEWCGDRLPTYRGTGQTLLLTFDADHMSMMGKKGFKFVYYADTPVARELVEGTDVLTIAGVLTIILVCGGLIFIVYRLCTRRKNKRKALKEDRQPITN